MRLPGVAFNRDWRVSMTARNLILVVAILLLAAFTALNWAAFVEPVSLSLGFSQVRAPLGLIMLGVCIGLCALFMTYVLLLQASVILESRRMAKDLHAQRDLADKAEASRFTETRSFIQAEVQQLREQLASSTRELVDRLAALEQRLSTGVDEAARGLSAHIGEVEDKLDRRLVPGRE
jgi:uncharacterized integral membrane protein